MGNLYPRYIFLVSSCNMRHFFSENANLFFRFEKYSLSRPQITEEIRGGTALEIYVTFRKLRAIFFHVHLADLTTLNIQKNILLLKNGLQKCVNYSNYFTNNKKSE